ncbi:permease [Amycolatopsis acidicola]|uniref:permease n=1 Tax=Amycolatopsis acidicola TaxID=2596893 RepID=UPI00140DE3C0|nr:permease [Amycolatopsis acidicola]
MLFAAGLLWAKWLPYAVKAITMASTHTWSGGAIFAKAGAPGASPSLSGAWRFSTAYFESVWPAAVVGLALAAGVDALMPKAWLLSALNRRTRLGQTIAGGVASLPSLMCTCCTAPVAVGLRRRGAGVAASLAYWVGNPVLNPAVLVFLFLVAPWQFGVTRLVVGVLLVVGASALVARLARPSASTETTTGIPWETTEPSRARDLPRRYLRSLGRFALIFVPEYVVVVFLVGALSGWLSDFSGLAATLGVATILVCAALGTLLVIPTGGEIPVVLALTATAPSIGSAGALLIALPALSLPSMIIVGRALSWRVTVAMAGAVALASVFSAVLLVLLW